MALTAWKIHTKFSQLIARWLNNFGIRLLKDEERKCMRVLTVRAFLGFLGLRQFPRCLSKPETHPGATAFRSRCLWIYSRGCKFCNSPSGRSGAPARITRAGGRPTDSGDAEVGTAGNIGISESAGGNENCASAEVGKSFKKEKYLMFSSKSDQCISTLSEHLTTLQNRFTKWMTMSQTHVFHRPFWDIRRSRNFNYAHIPSHASPENKQGISWNSPSVLHSALEGARTASEWKRVGHISVSPRGQRDKRCYFRSCKNAESALKSKRVTKRGQTSRRTILQQRQQRRQWRQQRRQQRGRLKEREEKNQRTSPEPRLHAAFLFFTAARKRGRVEHNTR